MIVTVTLKLNPTGPQREQIRATLHQAARAVHVCSRLAWDNQAFNLIPLQHLAYTDLRTATKLPSGLIAAVLARVVAHYRQDRTREWDPWPEQVDRDPNLPPGLDFLPPLDFTPKTMKLEPRLRFAALRLLHTRERIPFDCPERVVNLLLEQTGYAGLYCLARDYKWFLTASCDVNELSREDFKYLLAWGAVPTVAAPPEAPAARGHEILPPAPGRPYQLRIPRKQATPGRPWLVVFATRAGEGPHAYYPIEAETTRERAEEFVNAYFDPQGEVKRGPASLDNGSLLAAVLLERDDAGKLIAPRRWWGESGWLVP